MLRSSAYRVKQFTATLTAPLTGAWPVPLKYAVKTYFKRCLHMVITIDNPGQAILHFSRATTLMGLRYRQGKDCKQCDKELTESYRLAEEFFRELRNQLEEQINEQQCSF